LGDGSQDIKAGQAAGVRTCAARYGYGFLPELLELKPDFTIDAFIELKEIVK
jgi:phosphoglycolate phosphatase-like HAD superfamily hydrolase